MDSVLPIRQCLDCKQTITFEQFLRNHPHMAITRAISIWDDAVLSILCPKCYFNAPERPFKKNRQLYMQSYLRRRGKRTSVFK